MNASFKILSSKKGYKSSPNYLDVSYYIRNIVGSVSKLNICIHENEQVMNAAGQWTCMYIPECSISLILWNLEDGLAHEDGVD